MSQIQFLIIMDVLPVLFSIIVILLYIKSKKRTLLQKTGVVLFLLVSMFIVQQSFAAHKALFPKNDCIESVNGMLVTSYPSVQQTIWHKIFDAPEHSQQPYCASAGKG
ncbi:MAG: hypothetical protein ACQEQL_04150 [Pseudomonadota bacterium]